MYDVRPSIKLAQYAYLQSCSHYGEFRGAISQILDSGRDLMRYEDNKKKE